MAHNGFSSEQAVIAAHQAGRDAWLSALDDLSKSNLTGTFDIDFRDFSPRLTSSEAHELMTHVPLTCTGHCPGLEIYYANEKDGEGAIDGMLEWLEKKEANSFTYLHCYECKVGDLERGRAAGSRLASLLKSNHAQSMELLKIRWTDLIDSGNVSDWKSALEGMPNLKLLQFSGGGLSKEEMNILRNATHASTVNVFID